MIRRLTIALALTLTLVVTACTSSNDPSQANHVGAEQAGVEEPGSLAAVDDARDETEGGATESDTGTVRSADGVPQPSDLDGVEQLWVDNGTDPALANCYVGVLAGAGVEEVADLNELTRIMSNLDAGAKQAIDDCLG